MTPDQQAATSPYDLATPDGCRAEADRIYRIVRENAQPESRCVAAWLDWAVEASFVEELEALRGDREH